MKKQINLKDITTLIFWVQTFYVFEHKSFNHQLLFDKAISLYADKATSLYVDNANFTDAELMVNYSDLHIDEFMVDAYVVYTKMKKVSENVDIIDMFKVAHIKKDDVIRETGRYFDIFQDLIENYNYEEPEIREIQQGILNDKMLACVNVEDYENAAKYRDIIKEL